MNHWPARAFKAAAWLGFLAVALGAFGAHGLKEVFARHPDAAKWWETAVFYHAVNAIVLLVVASLRPFPKMTWLCFAAGVAIFSGSLYVMALTNLRWLGAVTPLGGLCLLAGWLLLAVRPVPSFVHRGDEPA